MELSERRPSDGSKEVLGNVDQIADQIANKLRNVTAARIDENIISDTIAMFEKARTEILLAAAEATRQGNSWIGLKDFLDATTYREMFSQNNKQVAEFTSEVYFPSRFKNLTLRFRLGSMVPNEPFLHWAVFSENDRNNTAALLEASVQGD